MKKREDIVQKFSTFLSFQYYSSGRNPTWQADPELERRMKRLAQLDPEAQAEFWARHFLKILREVSEAEPFLIPHSLLPTPHSPLSSLRAGGHLSAYLQEACLWAARKIYQRFQSLRHKYPLEEYFQIANLAANLPAKLLKNFNFEYPQTNIEGFAKTAITRFISNTIYSQDLEAKRAKFSDYGLLKNLNNKEVKEALVSKGITNQQIDLYCLAWRCFDEICQPNRKQGSRKLEPPNHQQLQQLAECYNQRRHQLDLPTVAVSGEKIKEMLSTCIQAARDYRTQHFLPLEDYENMPAFLPNPWDTLMQKEEWEQVQSLVSNLFSAMPEAGQTLLKLWQGLNFTQTEIAIVLQNKYPELQKQYQVARQLGRYTRNLLKDFAKEWNKVNPGICLNEDQEIERIKESLMECLQFHCQHLLSASLEEIWERHNYEKKMLRFSSHWVRKDLVNTLNEELSTSIEFPKESLDLVNNKVANFVDEWFKNRRPEFKSINMQPELESIGGVR